MRTVLSAVLTLILVLAACSEPPRAELDVQNARVAEARYIVVLDATAGPAAPSAARARAAEVARAHGLRPDHTYGAAIVGFSAEIPTGRIAALERDPRVKYVERDLPVGIFDHGTPTGIRRTKADELQTSTGSLLIDDRDDLRVDVDVAVLDTGIDLDHPDLNVAGGADCTLNSRRDVLFGNVACQDGGGDDDHYHGTHVAGTIGAIDDGAGDVGIVGMAPGARLWAVKVLDANGSGYSSEIVAGIDWVVEHGAIEVINMSLGGAGSSQATDDAIASATSAGVIVVVAAGNSADEAGGYTPANSPEAFTVSALADFDGLTGGAGTATCRDDQDDTLADFSNYDSTGDVVDMIAPGVCILSTYPLEQGGSGTISGTSMAAPHVAGAAALLMSGSGDALVAQVEAALRDAGGSDWNGDKDGVLEPLLNVTGFSATFVDGGATGDDGGTGGESGEGETPPAEDGSGVSLSASGYKVKGVHHVDLTWQPDGTYDLTRDDVSVATGLKGTSYTDRIGVKGSATYLYEICSSTDPSDCDTALVTF